MAFLYSLQLLYAGLNNYLTVCSASVVISIWLTLYGPWECEVAKGVREEGDGEEGEEGGTLGGDDHYLQVQSLYLSELWLKMLWY